MDESLPHVFDLDAEGLQQVVTSLGLPRFRAQQVLDWVYRRHVADPQAMTNLPRAERALLAERLVFTRGLIVQTQRASDGVRKLLIEWCDPTVDAARPATLTVLGATDRQTECVMIPAEGGDGRRGRDRRTACISSQIGCPVGCRFCASGLGGLDGNLTAGQIVEQVWRLGRLVREENPRQAAAVDYHPITHIVFMGMGEPLANFDAVVRAIGMLTASWGLGISARRITVSTVGLPAQIRRLAQIDLPITLAISLHAPSDALRRRIIPWAEFVSIDQLTAAARHYFDRTGREVTLEYILLRQVNDQVEHARALADVARSLRANVNLIRFNEVRGVPFDRPTGEDVHRFQHVLRQAGVNTHIRASRGRDIAAACGQLRHEATHP